MALFGGIQEYIALDNNISLVFDSGNIVNISGNIFLYPPQGHPILYKYEQIGQKEFFKSAIYNRNKQVYVWHMVASWACEVTVILTQNNLLPIHVHIP